MRCGFSRLRHADFSVYDLGMEETLRIHLLNLSEAFRAATGITPATVGKRAINDNTVFGRLAERDSSFNVRTYDRLIGWMSDRWPADAQWPADVPRPAIIEQVA